MSEYIVNTFGIVQDFADLHGDMSTPLYQAIMDVMVSRQREEIVRCRDCERVTIDQGDHDYREPLRCGLFHTDVSLDGFCAWGAREEKRMMSATDKLRRLLDEQGINHSDHYMNTSWRDVDGVLHVASEQIDKTLVLDCLTPEQAIAATSSRTCMFKPFKNQTSEDVREGVCSVCSAYMHDQMIYCPNCGCKVVDE